jgi:hypothetical protein
MQEASVRAAADHRARLRMPGERSADLDVLDRAGAEASQRESAAAERGRGSRLIGQRHFSLVALL